MHRLSAFLICLSTLPLYAQHENDTWIFGWNAGLHVGTDPPLPFPGAITNTEGATACVSDANGDLRFYASGTEVRDRTFALMPNGSALAGCHGSAQGALAVQFPDDPDRYYVFTNGASYTDTPDMYPGVSWSIVDMTLHGGLGDVSVKNVPLHPHLTEKLTATRHANGHDVWVVMHGYGTNEYYAYLVTCSGISGPVVSAVGGAIGSNDGPVDGVVADGWMQFDPQGGRLAAVWGEPVPGDPGDHLLCMDIVRFDRATGLFSDAISERTPVAWSSGSRPLGVCFSANGRWIYRTQQLYTGDPDHPETWAGRMSIERFDASATDPLATQVTIDSRPPTNQVYWAMQRMPTGVIIIGLVNGGVFSSLQHPDDDDPGFNFFGGSMGSAISYESMPNVWDTHPKAFTPLPDLRMDTIPCGSAGITIGVAQPFPLRASHYLWNTGDTTATITATHGGLYSVALQLPCSTAYRSIQVVQADCPPDPYGELIVPNVFSPDGDGHNDVFGAFGPIGSGPFALQVFDRWGLAVFESSDVNVRWDGRAPDGASVPAGVYFWVLSVGDGPGKRSLNGSVTLLR